MKKAFVIEDIADIRCLNGIALNASGTHAIFNQIEPELKKNVNNTRLFVLDRESRKVRQLTYTANHRSAVWDDDETVLLQTERKDEDVPGKLEEKSVFYRLNVNGGEARPAFSINRNVIGIRKFADALYLVKIEDDLNRVDPETDKEAAEEEKDYHVLEEVPFWSNGLGYIAGFHNGLYFYNEKDGSLEAITDNTVDVGFFTVQGSRIAYIASVRKPVAARYSMLCVYDAETKETVEIVGDNQLSVRCVAFRKDDLLFLGSDMKTWGNGQLPDWYCADPATGEYAQVRKNTEEFSFGGNPTTDCLRPGGTMFMSEGDDVYFTAMTHYHTSLYRYSKDNVITEVQSGGEGTIICFDKDEKGTVSVEMPQDGLSIVCMNGETVYDPNAALLAEKEVSVTIPHTILNRNGDPIEGWVLKPYNYDHEKTYPAVLEIHGGPRAAYGRVMVHEMQALAGKGMFVILCNPRGGDGYGEAFGDLRGKYGTIDYEDLMDYLDGILELYPNIDKTKLAACGGSYGGFMCNWLVGHTDRFAAIASQRSISNWLSDFGTSEIGTTFDKNEMGTDPWTDPVAMWNASPIKYACNAKTPILFIHSLVDYNCMIEQGAQMFTAMKYFGVPSRMVVFEGESHGLSRVGKPKHRIRRLREIAGWFEKYLG